MLHAQRERVLAARAGVGFHDGLVEKVPRRGQDRDHDQVADEAQTELADVQVTCRVISDEGGCA